MRAGGLFCGAILLAAACSAEPGSYAPTSTASAPVATHASAGCSELAPIVPHPTRLVGDGVRVGPLHLTVGAHFFREGYPTKVVIAYTEPLTRPVTLRGERCSDGRQLRFWYARDELPFGQNEMPVVASRLETTGDPMVELDAHQSARFPVGGYMLFSSAGRWRLWTSQGQEIIGSATIELVNVPPQHTGAMTFVPGLGS